MSMRLWLQVLVVLAFLQFVLASLTDYARFVVDLHFVVGLGVLGTAHFCWARLRRMPVPARLKRIARATALLATAQPFLGLPLYARDRLGYALPPGTDLGIALLHLITALGIIAEASATYTAFRMWEAKELS